MERYTDLLKSGVEIDTWANSQDFNPFVVQSEEVEEVPVPVRENKRSKNFSKLEDNLLVSAWLNTTLNLVVGIEQSRLTYWARIHRYFHENKDFPSDRNQNSLSNHWGTIQEQVNKFCGCYAQIQNKNQSGMMPEDNITEALSLYESASGKPFALMHCWNVLHLHPKWTEKWTQQKRKTSPNASPATSSPALAPSANSKQSKYDPEAEPQTDSELRRPPGKKAEKERLCRGKSTSSTTETSPVIVELSRLWSEKREFSAQYRMEKNERLDQAILPEKKRLELEEQKIVEKRQDREVEVQKLEIQIFEREERIITMDLTGMVGVQKEYYLRLQSEILARLNG